MKNYNTIFEKGQHKILACVERDAGSLRLSALAAVQLSDGKTSEPVAVQRQKLISHSTGVLEWLLNYEANVTLDDLKLIKDKILMLLEQPEKICETASKATQEEVLEKLVEFVKDMKEELSSINGVFMAPEAFQRQDKIYIRTNVFDTFISCNKDLGWGKFEVLKMLKRNDLLETGSGRVYDKKVKINKKGVNYYAIKRESMPVDDMADETIEIKERK